jgi:hypothetical protein
MNKKTGYVLCRVAFEYNDDGYDSAGLHPHSVYSDLNDARVAKRDATVRFAMEEDGIGEFCYAVDEEAPNILCCRFPDIFDKYGNLKMNGPKWSDGHAKVTQEAAEFIADNFSLFDIQKVDIYE